LEELDKNYVNEESFFCNWCDNAVLYDDWEKIDFLESEYQQIEHIINKCDRRFKD
jgi:hypothetical protein